MKDRELPYIRDLLCRELFLTNHIAVSCQRIDVDVSVIGEETLLLPEGKEMTRHQTLENGYEYEVKTSWDINV